MSPNRATIIATFAATSALHRAIVDAELARVNKLLNDNQSTCDLCGDDLFAEEERESRICYNCDPRDTWRA